MNAIPAPELHGEDRCLERVLYSLKGQPTPAVNVMERIGLSFSILQEEASGKWVVIPHSAYIEFYWLMRRAAEFFRGHGYRLSWPLLRPTELIHLMDRSD